MLWVGCTAEAGQTLEPELFSHLTVCPFFIVTDDGTKPVSVYVITVAGTTGETSTVASAFSADCISPPVTSTTAPFACSPATCEDSGELFGSVVKRYQPPTMIIRPRTHNIAFCI